MMYIIRTLIYFKVNTSVPGNNSIIEDFIINFVLWSFINALSNISPPSGTGLHRYVFMVWKQQGKEHFDKVHHLKSTSSQHRANFNTREFLKTYNMNELVAANFVQAEWDDYVPELYKTFTD